MSSVNPGNPNHSLKLNLSLLPPSSKKVGQQPKRSPHGLSEKVSKTVQKALSEETSTESPPPLATSSKKKKSRKEHKKTREKSSQVGNKILQKSKKKTVPSSKKENVPSLNIPGFSVSTSPEEKKELPDPSPCSKVAKKILSPSPLQQKPLTPEQERFKTNVKRLKRYTQEYGTGAFHQIGVRHKKFNFKAQKKGGEDVEELACQIMREAWGNLYTARQGGSNRTTPEALNELEELDLLFEKFFGTKKWIQLKQAPSQKQLTLLHGRVKKNASFDDVNGQVSQAMKTHRDTLSTHRENREKERLSEEQLLEGAGVNSTYRLRAHTAPEKVLAYKKPSIDKADENPLAGVKEYIGSALNIALGGVFPTPLVYLDEQDIISGNIEGKTVQSLYPRHGPQKLPQEIQDQLSPEGVQKFALLQMLLKTTDSHGGNIILHETNGKLFPHSIDHSASLHADPTLLASHPRISDYALWPGMEAPIDQDSVVTQQLLGMDVEGLLKTLLEEALEAADTQKDLPEEALSSLPSSLNHLAANLIFIQESIKEKLSPQQMLACLVCPIDLQVSLPNSSHSLLAYLQAVGGGDRSLLALLPNIREDQPQSLFAQVCHKHFLPSLENQLDINQLREDMSQLIKEKKEELSNPRETLFSDEQLEAYRLLKL